VNEKANENPVWSPKWASLSPSDAAELKRIESDLELLKDPVCIFTNYVLASYVPRMMQNDSQTSASFCFLVPCAQNTDHWYDI